MSSRNNTIHNNDNIGMDAIGFEQVGPAGYDQAKNGQVFGNLIYNNSAKDNPGEGKQYDMRTACIAMVVRMLRSSAIHFMAMI